MSFLYAVQLVVSVQNILQEALCSPPAKWCIFCFTDILSKMTVYALD